MDRRLHRPTQLYLNTACDIRSVPNMEHRNENYSELEQRRQELLNKLEDLRGAFTTARDEEETQKLDSGRETESSAKLIEEVNSIEKSIYGVDHRREIGDFNDVNILNNSSGVVSLVRKDKILDNGDGTFTLSTRTLGVSKGLCPDEKFYNQPVSPFCTGFLIADNIIATAGHCVENEADLADIRFVFGFKMINGKAQTVFDMDDLYAGDKIVNRVFVKDGPDWAIVQLNRRVDIIKHKVLNVRTSGRIDNNESVYVIGHPVGLPLKYADGANVRLNSNNEYFVANLDTFGGNSGSPVFNGNTHEVEGILVRGETDFIESLDSGCFKSKVCPSNGCRGEDCTRITEIRNSL
jgi:Trypsin-like peptidase domain